MKDTSNWRSMVTADYQPFFTASVAASSALIGLLFVSVSVAPEKVFGAQSDPRRQAQALSAFSALVNIFFISMTSLIPDIRLGIVVTIVAAVSLLQTLALLVMVPGWRREDAVIRGALLFLASVSIYGVQLWLGIDLWVKPSRAALDGLLELLLGCYAIGLGRAWELLGAPRMGLVSYLVGLLAGRLDRSQKKPQ